ncbi:lipopolysaccharide biosynthesis protein [Roseimaritima sediminicola]|uniref:lipopolysaccharide biosynthesis protein n=1 Tax=Roseimaritima sediminicola TaxID=2662066 RepID=UPI0012982EAD|nr:lipopolysaccharide biosynthesis protein [Roseimaritima sediminicola]
MSEAPSQHAARSHVRGSSLLLCGRVLALSMNFVVQVLIVRYLSKEGYGAFAYGYSVAMLAARFVPLGTEKAINRFVPIYHEQQDYGRVKGTLVVALATILTTGVLFVGATLVGRNLLATRVVQDPLALSVLLMIVALAPLQALENVLEKVMASFGRVRSLFFRRYLITPVLRLAAVVSLIVAGGNAVFLAAAYVAATALGVLISGHLLWRLLRERQLWDSLRGDPARYPAGRLFRFGLPLLSTDVAFGLRTSLVVVLLEVTHGISGVAAFRAVLPVARLNQAVFDSFRLMYVPHASRMFARDEHAGISRLYWTSTAWIALLTLPVLLVTFSFATPTVVLLFGAEYASSGPILALVALALYVNASFGFNALTLRVYDRVGMITKIDLLSALLALVLNVLLVPRFGPVGGAAVVCAVLAVQNLAYQMVLFRAGQLERPEAAIIRVHAAVIGVAVVLLIIQVTMTPAVWGIAGLILAATLGVWFACLQTLQIREHFPELARVLPPWFLATENGSSEELSEPTLPVDQVRP